MESHKLREKSAQCVKKVGILDE